MSHLSSQLLGNCCGPPHKQQSILGDPYTGPYSVKGCANTQLGLTPPLGGQYLERSASILGHCNDGCMLLALDVWGQGCQILLEAQTQLAQGRSMWPRMPMMPCWERLVRSHVGSRNTFNTWSWHLLVLSDSPASYWPCFESEQVTRLMVSQVNGILEDKKKKQHTPSILLFA